MTFYEQIRAALGDVTLTPESEAQLRAICDQTDAHVASLEDQAKTAVNDLAAARATFVQETADAKAAATDPAERIKRALSRPEIVSAAGLRNGMPDEEVAERINAALLANGE